jgi:hypothetical protein
LAYTCPGFSGFITISFKVAGGDLQLPPLGNGFTIRISTRYSIHQAHSDLRYAIRYGWCCFPNKILTLLRETQEAWV